MKCSVLTLIWFLFFYFSYGQAPIPSRVQLQVKYDPGFPSNRIVPNQVLGAAFDGHPQGDIDRILTPSNIAGMKTVGLQPITYRLRTELGIEAWHWSPQGEWSDQKSKQGYWISRPDSRSPLLISNGYFLPRRGNSHDQANDDGFSRIDDGDSTTFWKSNPYLDSHFTNDSNELHPQWVIIDLGRAIPVNSIRIRWGNPYALSYTADYAGDIGHDYFDPLLPGLWHSFSNGNVFNDKAGNKIVRVDKNTLMLRFLRITMTRSSYTTATGSDDIRDQLGFAIEEMQVGVTDRKGVFHDWVKHKADNSKQSIVHVSSTDPWHRESDLDTDTEQTGFDRFFTSGITNGQPTMMPVALLYDNPDNMAAMVNYLLEKKYPVLEMELGEEPEGQLINPEDYASLYCQWAKVIKQVAPTIRLGGPCFASITPQVDDSTSFTERTWTKRFLNFLRAHNQLSDFDFFSFEWYPFDDVCAPPAPQLLKAPSMLSLALKPFRDYILPEHTPVYVTEYGYSSHSGRAEVDIEGALMYADILGQFLTMGGDKAFLYGYEPTYLDQYHGCSWGNNMLFCMNDSGHIIYKTAAYYGLNLLMHHWATPMDSVISIFPVSNTIRDTVKASAITSYAAQKPGGKWSLLIINKDPVRPMMVNVAIDNRQTGATSHLHYPLHYYQYSGKQYAWKADGIKGHPLRTLLPTDTLMSEEKPIFLPPYSMTIVEE